MGMYDTFYLNEPMFCPYCGKKVNDIQCKGFENRLMQYKVGDTLDKRYFEEKFKGNLVYSQDIYCSCGKANEERFTVPLSTHFYLVFKKYVFIGVTASRIDAEFIADFDDDSYEYEW